MPIEPIEVYSVYILYRLGPEIEDVAVRYLIYLIFTRRSVFHACVWSSLLVHAFSKLLSA